MKDAMARGWQERTVTVDRERLLKTLKANLEKHKRNYQESLDGYKVMAHDNLRLQVLRARRMIEEADGMIGAQIDLFDPENPIDSQVVVCRQVSFTLEVPQDHSYSYEVALKMAEWEVSETVELTQSQFECFIMDNWEWKDKFEHLNKTYAGAIKK